MLSLLEMSCFVVDVVANSEILRSKKEHAENTRHQIECPLFCCFSPNPTPTPGTSNISHYFRHISALLLIIIVDTIEELLRLDNFAYQLIYSTWPSVMEDTTSGSNKRQKTSNDDDDNNDDNKTNENDNMKNDDGGSDRHDAMMTMDDNDVDDSDDNIDDLCDIDIPFSMTTTTLLPLLPPPQLPMSNRRAQQQQQQQPFMMTMKTTTMTMNKKHGLMLVILCGFVLVVNRIVVGPGLEQL